MNKTESKYNRRIRKLSFAIKQTTDARDRAFRNGFISQVLRLESEIEELERKLNKLDHHESSIPTV